MRYAPMVTDGKKHWSGKPDGAAGGANVFQRWSVDAILRRLDTSPSVPRRLAQNKKSRSVNHACPYITHNASYFLHNLVIMVHFFEKIVSQGIIRNIFVFLRVEFENGYGLLVMGY